MYVIVLYDYLYKTITMEWFKQYEQLENPEKYTKQEILALKDTLPTSKIKTVQLSDNNSADYYLSSNWDKFVALMIPALNLDWVQRFSESSIRYFNVDWMYFLLNTDLSKKELSILQADILAWFDS